jgi:hypothetical protein
MQQRGTCSLVGIAAPGNSGIFQSTSVNINSSPSFCKRLRAGSGFMAWSLARRKETHFFTKEETRLILFNEILITLKPSAILNQQPGTGIYSSAVHKMQGAGRILHKHSGFGMASMMMMMMVVMVVVAFFAMMMFMHLGAMRVKHPVLHRSREALINAYQGIVRFISGNDKSVVGQQAFLPVYDQAGGINRY